MRRKATLLWIVYSLQNEELQGKKFTFPEACRRIADRITGSPGLKGPFIQHLGYRRPPSARALGIRLRRFMRSPGYQEALLALDEQGGPPRAFVEGFWTPEARRKRRPGSADLPQNNIL